MGKFKKVCATIGRAAIISAAIMGMVDASTTGLDEIDKSFFYDENYNPKVQIVIGTASGYSDAIASGNIAATIGNLAYTTGACGASVASAGEVKLAVKSWQMIGTYEQDIKGKSIGTTDLEGSFLSSTPYGSFYSTDGQLLANGTLAYTHGMLKNYNIGCQIDKTVADFPMKVKNCNDVCYLGYGISQLDDVAHPDHEMKETINVDGTKVKYYEDGLGCDSKAELLKMKLDCGALEYTVELGGIPVSAITDGDNLIDSSYVPYESRPFFSMPLKIYASKLNNLWETNEVGNFECSILSNSQEIIVSDALDFTYYIFPKTKEKVNFIY